MLRTDRGGSAVFPAPAADRSEDVATVLADLLADATTQRRLAVVLVRRGGYAIGDMSGAEEVSLRASKNGSRYVQGRTAAGGQSQQRFARRRANQADALAGAAADAAVQVLGIRARPVDVLVTGGDQALVDQVLADPRLRWLADLPDHRTVDVADPRKRTLEEAALKALSIRVKVTNSPEADPSARDQ